MKEPASRGRRRKGRARFRSRYGRGDNGSLFSAEVAVPSSGLISMCCRVAESRRHRRTASFPVRRNPLRTEYQIEFRNRHRRSLFERRNDRDAHVALTQNRGPDRAELQSPPTVAPVGSDDNQIDLLTLGDLEQGAFWMPPARRDRGGESVSSRAVAPSPRRFRALRSLRPRNRSRRRSAARPC